MMPISGYGQPRPMRDLAGFGVVAEPIGGFRCITGKPGQAPVRHSIGIGDPLSPLHGMIGILLALYHRVANGWQGQMVDVAL
jgi:formyl-CoA transferase